MLGTDWKKKLANIATTDLKEETKDSTWVSYVIAFLLGIPILGATGLAGGLVCYLSICMGASIGDIQATLYVCIFILVFLGLLFCLCWWLTKKIYKKNKKAYRMEVQNRKNQSLGRGQPIYGRQPQPQTTATSQPNPRHRV